MFQCIYIGQSSYGFRQTNPLTRTWSAWGYSMMQLQKLPGSGTEPVTMWLGIKLLTKQPALTWSILDLLKCFPTRVVNKHLSAIVTDSELEGEIISRHESLIGHRDKGCFSEGKSSVNICFYINIHNQRIKSRVLSPTRQSTKNLCS